MAKKKTTSPKSEQKEDAVLIPQGAVYPGMVLMLIGFVAFYMSGRANPGMFTWQSYISLGILAVGALLWFTSGMDKPQLIEWFRSAFIALILALTIRWAIAEPYRIPSGSMEPTLHGDPAFGKGDRVFVNKYVYGIRYPFMNKRIWYGHDPQRWDLVVFKTVEDDAIHKTLVKRIVGMPGEQLKIRNGSLYANGELLALPKDMPQDLYYTSPPHAPYGITEIQIPEGHYLVLGDNSAHSRDGRYFGWLPNEHIVGRVACIWWPPPRWRDFTGFSDTLWWRICVAILLVCLILRLFVGRLCPVQLSGNPPRQDHLIVSFFHYGFHIPFTKTKLVSWKQPERGDVVLFSAKEKDHKELHLLVGRIAALPGEQVALVDGDLVINDIPTKLPVPAPNQYVSTHRDALYGRGKGREYSHVPEKHYFILGDGEYGDEVPYDSRSLGWIPESQVLGRAVVCWWPLARMGRR